MTVQVSSMTPLRPQLDIGEFDPAMPGSQIVVPRVEDPDAIDGFHMLPVGLHLGYGTWVESAARPTAIYLTPWSVSQLMPYQFGRYAIAAHSGVDIIAPNAVGQGRGSPELTDKQKEQFSQGDATDAGKVAVRAALRAYEEAKGELPKELVVFGESQGGSLIAAALKELAEQEVVVSHVVAVSPASTYQRSKARLRYDEVVGVMLRGKQNEYRSRNPENIPKEDVKVPWSLLNQVPAHAKHYPELIARHDLVGAVLHEISRFDRRPEIHIVGVNHDLVSRLAANRRAAETMQGTLHEFVGTHFHSEDLRAHAYLIAEILGLERRRLQPLAA